MRRRDFIALIAGIAALPLAAHAQQAVPSIAQTASTDISKCAQNSVGFPQRLDGPRWNGWGADLSNSRFQPAGMAGLTRDQVPLLRLKWAFGFLGRPAAVAQPTIVGGLVFVGGGDREVYALDAKSGCDPDIAQRAVSRSEVLRWFTKPDGESHTFNMFPDLERIRCPTLVLGGEDDPIHPIESQADIAAALPRHLVQFERFPNCGHAVIPDAPERAMAVIRDFISNQIHIEG